MLVVLVDVLVAAIGIFAVVCVLLFAAQLTSVWVFGAESEAKGAEGTAAEQGASASSHTIKVQEKEFRITLPAWGAGT